MDDNSYFGLASFSRAVGTIQEQAKEIERLKEEVAKLRKATEWKPIETAPYAKVLLYYPEQTGRNALSEWIIIGLGKAETFRKPTHWMPLPKPPATEGGE